MSDTVGLFSMFRVASALPIVALASLLVGCSDPNPLFGLSASGTEGGAGEGQGGGSEAGRPDDDGNAEGQGVVDGSEGSGVGGGGSGGTEPFCGDQVTDQNEQCDDGNENPWDGCVACSIPSSCLEVLDLDDEAESGPHLIWPDGVDDYVDVFCDMETDGGGYTFLKLDAGAGAASAEQAEAECKAYGMQLWIPRTPDHFDAGIDVALDPEIDPGGSSAFLEIMGVRPEFPGASCGGQPLNSDNPECDWHASDDEAFFITDSPMGPEPNGDTVDTVVVSMQYYWSNDGVLTDFNDWPGGHSARRFMCDVGDKY